MKTPLTDEQKDQVRAWMKAKKYRRCPFLGLPCDLCTSWFPIIKGRHACPCNNYPLNTVLQRARMMLKTPLAMKPISSEAMRKGKKLIKKLAREMVR